MPKLQLDLLGPFQITLEGAPVTAFESNKVRALLAYLAVEASRPQPRERLAALLWPDWPPQSAMSNLRYALADLRKNLGDRQASPPYLLISRESLQLNPAADIRVDVGEFEAAIRDQKSSINNLQSAISLYRGPFLEGFSLADSAPFEEWLLAKREYFNRQMLAALQRLADRYEQSGQFDPARCYVQRQLDLEPWREEAHQQMMRLLALSGQRSAALAQYEKCRRALGDGLGVAPGVETTALYNNIRDGSLAPVQPAGAVAERVPLPAAVPPEEPAYQVSRPRHNLPRHLTRFIGRESQVAQVLELVRQNALVTLTGPGGVGKTRLGLAAAEVLLGEYKDGVWLVELASVTDPHLIPQVLANVLGMHEKPSRPIHESNNIHFSRISDELGVLEKSGQPLLDTLSLYFRGRETLLVLDNCEHLVEACAGLAQALLGAAPRLKVLVTSREALGVPGEVALRVPSLLFPPPGQAQEAEALGQYESVRLFLDRAGAVVTGYQLTPSNAVAVAQICQRLDGIPLAIELAAARVSSLEAAQIAARLDQAFRLLAGGNRAALERHRTLRATVDWSYNLLSAAERILLQRLSVFSGGWTLEAVESVCGGEGVDEAEVLDWLSQLVNKSMILADRSVETGLRYRMLETIRQYAAEKLYETGESERLHQRHLAYFLAFAERLEDGLRGPELLRRLNRLEAELDNFRLALEWGLQTDVVSELRLASALMWFWHIHSSHRSEGLNWLQQGLAAETAARAQQESSSDPSLQVARNLVRAKALSAAGLNLINGGEKESIISVLEESLALYRGSDGDQRWGIAFANLFIGYCYRLQEPARAYPFIEQSQFLFEEIGDKVCVCDCLTTLAGIEPDRQRAKQIILDMMAIAKESRDINAIATAAKELGWATYRLGNYAETIKWLRKSVEGYRQVGNSWSMADQLFWMGVLTWHLGDYTIAGQHFIQAADLYWEVGNPGSCIYSNFMASYVSISAGLYWQARQLTKIALERGGEILNWRNLAWAQLILGRIDLLSGDDLQAARRLEEALNFIGEHEDFGAIGIDIEYLSGRLALGRGDFPRAGTHYKKCLQICIEKNALGDAALIINELAILAARCGEMERAALQFGASEVVFPYLINILSPTERGWREQDIQTTRLALGEARYQELSDLGRGMSLEQAVAYAKASEN